MVTGGHIVQYTLGREGLPVNSAAAVVRIGNPSVHFLDGRNLPVVYAGRCGRQ